jgi:type II secretory pathway component PulF
LRLAALCKAGFTVPAAFVSLAESGAGTDAVARAVEDIRGRLAAGTSLSESLAAHPEAFDPAAASFVRAGETSGRLSDAVAALAGFLASEQEWHRLWQRFLRGLTYPATALAIVPACLCAGTLIWPGTAALRLARLFLALYVTYRFPAALALVTWLLMRIRAAREWTDKTVLGVAGPGRLAHQLLVLRVVLTLDAANRAGLTIREAVLLAGERTDNTWLRSQARALADATGSGSDFAAAVRASALLPGSVAEAIAHAHETSTEDQSLATLAVQMKADVVSAVGRFSLVAYATAVVLVCAGIVGVGIIILMAAMR